MTEELQILKDVCRRLDEAGILYMITGSTASNFYTVPRMTRDIDMVLEVGTRDAERILGLFAKDFL